MRALEPHRWLAGGAVLLLASAVALAQPQGGVELPGGPLTIYAHPETGELFGLTANARYHVKIEALTDGWQGTMIDSLDALALATTLIPFAELQRLLPDLEPLTVGEGGEPVVAFVSPSCPACHVLFRQLARLTDRYRFHLLLIARDEADRRLVQKLACAVDPDAAVEALLRHDYGELAPGTCDPTAAARRAVTAQLLGVRGTPFLVRADGVVHEGLPDDLATWLDGSRP